MMDKLLNRKTAYRTLRFLGSPLIRLVIIFFSVVVAIYLGYINGYAPFWEDVQFPSAVQTRSARIDTNTLEAIIEEGKQRNIHSIHTYDQYQVLFTTASGG